MSNPAVPDSEPQATSFSEFRAGLLEPSWLAAGTAIVVPVLGLLLLATWLTPDLMRSDRHAYLAFGRDDSQLFSTSKLLRTEPLEFEVPAIFVLGASGLAEAITDEEHLQSIVTSALGRDVRAIDLTSYGQSVVETGIYADRLPARFDGLVLIGISPFLLAEGFNGGARRAEPLGSRHGIRSDFVEGLYEMRERPVPPLSGNYFWDHRRFYLSRLPYALKNLFTGPVELRRHRYREEAEPLGAAKRERQLGRVRNRSEFYEAHRTSALEFLETLARELEKRGRVTLVLLETPVAPYAIRDGYGEELYTEHLRCMEEFAQSAGVAYWNPGEEAAFEDAEFFDYTHLSSEAAQVRFTEIVGARAAAHLGGS